MDKIPRFEKGSDDRTLLHTEEANKLVDAINAILSTEFLPTGSCKQEMAGDKRVITITCNQVVRGFQENPTTGELKLGTFAVLGKFTPDRTDTA